LKAIKFIIKDIVKNNLDILKEDLIQILKIFYKNYWDSKYLNSSKFLDSIDRGLSDKDIFYIK
jgi:recombinational DNA repair protein (RecF pathway)